MSNKEKFDSLKEMVDMAKAKDSELAGQMKQLTKMVKDGFDVDNVEELGNLLSSMKKDLEEMQAGFEKAQEEIAEMLEEL